MKTRLNVLQVDSTSGLPKNSKIFFHMDITSFHLFFAIPLFNQLVILQVVLREIYYSPYITKNVCGLTAGVGKGT